MRWDQRKLEASVRSARPGVFLEGRVHKVIDQALLSFFGARRQQIAVS